MLRRFADHEIQQLNHNSSQHQPDQKSFGFIPQPGAKLLRGQLETSLQPECVIVKAEAERLADKEQQEQINKNGERVVLECPAQGEVAQPVRPTGDQQKNQEC